MYVYNINKTAGLNDVLSFNTVEKAVHKGTNKLAFLSLKQWWIEMGEIAIVLYQFCPPLVKHCGYLSANDYDKLFSDTEPSI